MVKRKKGHFYSMTTHAKGGVFLIPESVTVVDMGALFVRAIAIDHRGKVINYKMTGQCASGSGQFVENISRYLGLSIEEVGETSLKATKPETPSGICAVLGLAAKRKIVFAISNPNIFICSIALLLVQRAQPKLQFQGRTVHSINNGHWTDSRLLPKIEIYFVG